MIDRIRHDIQERLDQLLAEADKLRRALAALGSRDGPEPASRPPSRPAPANAQSRKRSTTTADTASAKQPKTMAAKPPTRSGGTKPPTARRRTASGATKRAVLAALATGQAMTASDVATATGLGRATVSTTLSKLAKTGEVSKAQRGYRIAEPSKPAS